MKYQLNKKNCRDIVFALWRRSRMLYNACVDEIFGMYRLFTGGYQKLEKGEKVRIIFLASFDITWYCYLTVYQSLLHNNDVDVLVLADDYPRSDIGRLPSRFFAVNNIDFLNIADYDNKAYKPHVVFVSSILSVCLRNFWVFRSRARLVYIPYGTSIAFDKYGKKHQYNRSVHNKAWKVFVAGNFAKELYGLFCSKGNKHVFPYGHPKTELVYNSMHDGKRPCDSDNRKKYTFLWNIHFDRKQFTTRWSTWPEYGAFILNLFSCCDDVQLICRPHSLFFETFTSSEAVKIRNLITQNKNTVLDEDPSTSSSFQLCDALITDGSSLIYDFVVTSKPILYLRTTNSEKLHPHCYNLIKSYHFIGDNVDKIRDFVDMVRGRVNQNFDNRKNILEHVGIPHPSGIGDKIAQYVIGEVKKESQT